MGWYSTHAGLLAQRLLKSCQFWSLVPPCSPTTVSFKLHDISRTCSLLLHTAALHEFGLCNTLKIMTFLPFCSKQLSSIQGKIPKVLYMTLILIVHEFILWSITELCRYTTSCTCSVGRILIQYFSRLNENILSLQFIFST